MERIDDSLQKRGRATEDINDINGMPTGKRIRRTSNLFVIIESNSYNYVDKNIYYVFEYFECRISTQSF